MNNNHDLLEVPACGGAWEQAEEEITQPYEEQGGILQFLIPSEVPPTYAVTFWVSSEFRARDRKVLRALFTCISDTPGGWATFQVDVNTYTEGTYLATLAADSTLVDIYFPAGDDVLAKFDLEITPNLLPTNANNMVEIILTRLPYRGVEQDTMDIYELGLLHIRTLDTAETTAADTAGTVIPWT